MSSAAQSILAEWSPPPGLTAAIVLTAAVYVRGWLAIRRTRAAYFTGSRLASFLAGLAVLWLAIASPLDGFADTLLSAHMVQHFLLMSAVPPLMLLGAPVVPLLRGLPRDFVRGAVGPLLRLRAMRTAAHWAAGPAVAWLLFNASFIAWHLPRAYDYALRHERVHDLEHLCFLATSLLFWYVVLEPWPARRRADGWIVLLYLLSADIVNTGLSAFLAFSNRAIYGYYSAVPNPFGVSALSDQVTAGVIMWVLNSTVFLVPVMVLAVRMADGGARSTRNNRSLEAVS